MKPVIVDGKPRLPKGVSVVRFSAKWCAGCVSSKDIHARLVESMKGKVSFFEVDAAEDREFFVSEGISSYPTYRIYRDGRPVKTVFGIRTSQFLKEQIESVLKPRRTFFGDDFARFA